MRKLFFVALLFLMGCACNPQQRFGYSSPASIKKAIKSVVSIDIKYETEDKITLSDQVKEYYASGFSIETHNNVSYILTNQHVCAMREKSSYTLMTSDRHKIPATFVKVDIFADICLLKAAATIPPLILANSNSTQGERVLSIGAPDGVFPIIVDGIISGYFNFDASDKEENFEVHFRSQITSIPIYLGSSGSPVFNIDGKVVGIVFAVRSGGKEHISFIVPVSEVNRFLESAEYVYTY